MVSRAALHTIAAEVVDPELPMLTLADLGVLRDVAREDDGRVVVSITPTYSGCPAVAAMADGLRARLAAAGYPDIEVRTVLSPPWTTDWITDDGRRKLAEHGIAPPSPAGKRSTGPIPLTLHAPEGVVHCPQCGSSATAEVSRFAATPCTALRRCLSCHEPFPHVKEI